MDGGCRIALDLLEQLGFSSSFDFFQCHVDTNSLDHVCIKGKCFENYSFQTCGNGCGVSVIVTSALAIYESNTFSEYCLVKPVKPFTLSYLKNISHYNDFLRLCLIRWMLGHSNLLEDINFKRSNHSEPASINPKVLIDDRFADTSSVSHSSTGKERKKSQPPEQTKFKGTNAVPSNVEQSTDHISNDSNILLSSMNDQIMESFSVECIGRQCVQFEK